MTAEVLDDLQHPEDEASKRALGSSFYAAMRIMPPGQREAMFEIYSFCRAVDDIADDIEGDAEARLRKLDLWRRDIDAVYRGVRVRGLSGLAVAVRDFGLEREDFRAVIDGMETDVRGPVRAPSFDELDLYCDRVASAVGRLSVKVFRMPDHEGRELSEHLGRALQLTNILRDLDDDAAISRLYLPHEFLVDEGIESVDPDTVLAHPALGEVCNRIVKLARWHFAEADRIMKAHPRRMVRTPRVMSEAYKAILSGLIKRGFKPPRTRVKLSKPRIVYIVLRHCVV
ncbi:presqualene diphosphate synthase HpnD [Rhodomicrobium sp.]|uniref:presqualene diphosphate synthase HpnD n=1 Tax=Rhodomicrobium sp. TaxID=2720632 RepID=UPI0039E4B832